MLNINRSHNRQLTLDLGKEVVPEVGIFRTRTYGDPFMVEKMGLDTAIINTTNFQNIDLFTPNDWFKSVSVFQKLSKTELDYLIALQPVDAGGFSTKMGFLCGERIGPPARPYWTRGGTWQDLANGDTSVLFEFGTMVFGGQLVKVETDVNNLPKLYQFRARYQSETDTQVRLLDFYKLIGMRRAEMGKFTHATHPWFIQRCTWASWGNTYSDTWNSGVIYHPVWSPYDYPTNNGNNALYIAREFLLP